MCIKIFRKLKFLYRVSKIEEKKCSTNGKQFFKKPLFIIVMVGVSLIPALYNVIFLSSMWNPYGKVSELPVAVVNKDQHATFNSNTLSVGDDMVKSLRKNDALDFHFVSEAKAKKRLGER